MRSRCILVKLYFPFCSSMPSEVFPQAGHKKLGRHFFGNMSLASLSKEARQASVPAGTVEFDQETAVVSIMVKLAKDFDISTPCLQLYMQHKHDWRRLVMKYTDSDESEAKALLMRAVFGFAIEDQQWGVLPVLQGRMFSFQTCWAQAWAGET